MLDFTFIFTFISVSVLSLYTASIYCTQAAIVH